MLDLYQATRDEVIQLVHQQRAMTIEQARQMTALKEEVAELRAVLATLTTQLGLLNTAPADGDASPGMPAGMPGLKPVQAPERPARPRKRRAKGAGRTRMVATAWMVHALAACPECGAPLAGGTLKRTREVIEVPPPQVVVTEHRYLERRCPDCGCRCVPTPELAGVVPGHGRLGNRLVSLIAVLRATARLPFATIQTLLQTLYGVRVSVGALVGAVQRVAVAGSAALADCRATIRASPVVHADETGWRENGPNGYVWTFSTPDTRLFVRDTREKRVLTETVGATFSGVLISDFSSAYTGYEGRHQYCWAHLLREIEALVTDHPADARLRGWAHQMRSCFAHAHEARSADARTRARVAAEVRTGLLAGCSPWLSTAPTPPDPPVVPAHRRLCQRITRFLPELLTFVTEEAVPPTNNAAERSLRPLVVSRKISGGTRSAQGSLTKMTRASLFGTWRLRGCDPFIACQALLATL